MAPCFALDALLFLPDAFSLCFMHSQSSKMETILGRNENAQIEDNASTLFRDHDELTVTDNPTLAFQWGQHDEWHECDPMTPDRSAQ